jgi:hypothetical protein
MGALARRSHPALYERGSPANPMRREQLAAKLRRLAGTRLHGLLDDPTAAARDALAASGLA